MSKDSADAATALYPAQHVNKLNSVEWVEMCVVREKAKSGIKTVTEVLLSLYNSILPLPHPADSK